MTGNSTASSLPALRTLPSAGAGPLRVLVVDDEPLIRWSVTETLAAAGHRVFEAGDAASTRHLLDHLDAPPDVVLLDYRLPDSDDLSLLSDVRRLSPGSAVVMMSAHGAPDVAAAAAALGAHGMIDKPFDVASIDTLLREASLIHRQGRAPRR